MKEPRFCGRCGAGPDLDRDPFEVPAFVGLIDPDSDTVPSGPTGRLFGGVSA